VAVTPEDVGLRIREARVSRGWTHEELARRVGVNWRTVQRWQKGNLPRVSTLLRLEDVLGVPPGHLVEAESSLESLQDLRLRVDELTERVETLTRLLSAESPRRPSSGTKP
jgi:transcriptional regulator with XRE-family HTH domain